MAHRGSICMKTWHLPSPRRYRLSCPTDATKATYYRAPSPKGQKEKPTRNLHLANDTNWRSSCKHVFRSWEWKKRATVFIASTPWIICPLRSSLSNPAQYIIKEHITQTISVEDLILFSQNKHCFLCARWPNTLLPILLYETWGPEEGPSEPKSNIGSNY
jgi:hypothetical protein